ncbi:hypothetical protein JD844_018310 [Phrynosoma platyrhinos]|uniref:C2H2-type domain-containing protein n=1 Tax=Phrynosoma platyrhinos TaxID=52577 RepID=A0ABQ7SNB2_PHRPL|nr:hypothetical protein JD844_018310 [Phrynosoma platyrhinos]
MSLSDGSTAYIQQDASGEKLIEEQVTEPEDGSTAFVQHITMQKEGYDPNTLEAIQSEDGSTAFVHHPVSRPMGSAILTVQADVGLEELATGKKDDTFDLDNIAAFKDCASKGFQEKEVRSNGKGPNRHGRGYRCEHNGCGRFFTTAHHLKLHARIHRDDCPYRCNFPSCGKIFSTGEKPFRCPFEGCGRCFTTSNIRKIHIRTHTGERPYMCPEPHCGRGFTSTTNYKNHMRIHTGERPYACLVPGCGKCFTEYSSLYKHHVVHTHCKPYTCNTCGKNYRQTSTLAMHKRTTHGELEATEESELAFYEQHLEVATAESQLNVVSVKEEDEEEDCMPLVSQDEAEQLKNQQSLEDAINIQQESATVEVATSKSGCGDLTPAEDQGVECSAGMTVSG